MFQRPASLVTRKEGAIIHMACEVPLGYLSGISNDEYHDMSSEQKNTFCRKRLKRGHVGNGQGGGGDNDGKGGGKGPTLKYMARNSSSLMMMMTMNLLRKRNTPPTVPIQL
jgi:hypothetical protein